VVDLGSLAAQLRLSIRNHVLEIDIDFLLLCGMFSVTHIEWLVLAPSHVFSIDRRFDLSCLLLKVVLRS
jgi:hypothetical protein